MILCKMRRGEILYWLGTKSEWAFIARVIFMAALAPTHVVSNHASLAWLDLCCAAPYLPTFAQLLSIHKNFTIVWNLNAWAR